MAKQKRLNKNLVAFLTVMLMVVAVSVFTLVVWQQSRRDPEALAKTARESKQAGDLEEAARRFMRAWDASETLGKPNTQYAIDAAGCLFEMGEIGRWHGLLAKTSAREPNDQAVPTALLTGLWHGRDISGGVVWPSTWPDVWRDTGQKLRQLDENSVLAAVSLARGLWELKGPDNIAAGDKAAEDAFQRAPLEPRAVLTYMELLDRRRKDELGAASTAGAPQTKLQAINRNFVQTVLSVLGPALEEHPGDVPLVVAYMNFLQGEAANLTQTGDATGAADLLAKAGAAFERATKVNEAHPSPDLCLRGASLKLYQFNRAHPTLTPAELVAAQPEIEQIASLARQATELDPAVFEGYNLQAELTQRFAVGADGKELTPEERAAKAVEIYEAAKDRTLTLRNLRALMGDSRLHMLRRALDLILALRASAGTRGTPIELTRAEAFLEDARVKYPEHPVTYYMQAQLQIAKNDALGAIKALTSAYEKADPIVKVYFDSSQARYWLVYVGVSRLPSEQLALLYLNRSQGGEAQRYAEAAVREFTEVGATPPVTLVANYAQLLRQIDRAKDALVVLDQYDKAYPDDANLRAVRVDVLNALDRPDEAKKLLGQIADTGTGSKLWRAQMAVEQEDYAAAESILREVLADTAATDDQVREALQRLVDVLDRTHRRPDARTLVAAMLKNPPRAGLERLLKRYEFELAVENPDALSAEQRKELDAKRKEMIEANPDATTRAQELLMFHEAHGEWEEALKSLDELRRKYPDELRLTEEEFRLRLRLKQFDQAGELSATLAHYDNGTGFDRAGGASYRGDLEQAKGNPEAAIREYRQAEQQLPKSSDLEVKLGRSYVMAGRIPEAIEALQQAVQFNPRSFEGYWLLRQIYRQKAAQSFGAEKTESEAAAADAQAKATELNPNHPEVLAWTREADEEREPLKAIAAREKRRAADPADTENLTRLGELYLRAWRQVADQPPDAQQNVIAPARQFFQAVIPTTTGDTQSALARCAAEFYSLAKLSDEGRTLLEALLAQRTGEGRVEAQVLLAMFYESLGNNDAAERAYAQAQQVVREVTSDADARRLLDSRVGMLIIRFQERQQRLDKVVEACRWLLDRLGSGADQVRTGRQVRLTLIEALFNSGQIGDAAAELTDFLKLYPGNQQGLSTRAQLYVRQRDYPRALADLNEILAKDPTDVLALYTRGRLALEAGHYDKAREDLTNAEELLPHRPRLEVELRRQLAALYLRLREYDQAATQYRTLLDVLERQQAPKEQKQQVMRQLAHLLYGAMDQFENARRLISEYMEKHPNEALWPYELARLFEVQAAKAERDAGKARDRGDTSKEQEQREAARQNYNSAVTYYQRAADRAGEQNVADRLGSLTAQMNALTKAGRGAEAVEVFHKIDFAALPAEFREGARARLGMEAARALQALKQDEAARKQWQQALRDASAQNITLTAAVANSLQDAFAHAPAAGVALLQQTAESTSVDEPAGQRLRLALAAQLSAAGNGAAALPIVTEVLPKLQARTPERVSALLSRARSQELTHDVEGAVRTYREILTDDASNPSALNNLAYTLVTADPPIFAPAEARKYAEQLRAFVPGNENAATMLDTIGWVYFKNGELDLAAAALEEATSADGASAAMFLHLAEVYAKLNRTVDARNALNQGLDKARQDGDAEQVRQLEEALNKLGK